MAQPGAGEAFRAAVILGHSLQDNAPPEIPVDLDVPFVPTGIGRVAPVLFVEQRKDRTEEMMAILPLLAPIAAMAQTPGEFPARRQLFVLADDRARGAFEMEP